MAAHSITVKINLGTARSVAEFAHYAITQGIIPDREERRALLEFARAVAGPIYGNALGREITRRFGEASE